MYRSILTLASCLLASPSFADTIEVVFRNTTTDPINSIRVCLGEGQCTNYPVSCASGESECTLDITLPDGYDPYESLGISDPRGDVTLSSSDVRIFNECPTETEPPPDLSTFQRVDFNGDGIVQLSEAATATACAVNQVCD
jgi:hypothetical protein